MSRQYKITVRGDTAERMLKSLPETEWLDDLRQSIIVFVVATTGDANRRNEDIDNHQTPTEKDEEAYLLDIMTLDDGTFPDFSAKEVTDKPWNLG